MFKDKAYVCNLCRKVITYSPEEAGKTMSCPFCKSTVTLPTKWARTRTAGGPKAKRRAWLFALLSLTVSCAAAVWLVVACFGASDTVQALPVISALLDESVTVAPAAVHVHGSRLSVAITDVWFGQPDICNAAINKTEPAQTPVCCVKLAITNSGKEPAAFLTWREAEQTVDLEKILLKGADGLTNSLVSFGPGCAPAGYRARAEIAPGESAQDLLLFLCKAKPASDLELTLPCSNLGAKGLLSFRIPREMIR